jgi:hypothetical protein
MWSQPAHRLLAQRNQPLAIALARHAQHALVQVQLRILQRHQFRNAQAGGVQHLEHGAVAGAKRIGDHGRVQQRLDFILGQRLGQRAADLRHRDLGGGILAQRTFAHEVPVKTTERRKLPRRRAWPRTGFDSPGDESKQVGTRSLGNRCAARGKPARQCHQIRPVGCQRVGRKAAFHPGSIQKARHGRINGLSWGTGRRSVAGRLDHFGFPGRTHGGFWEGSIATPSHALRDALHSWNQALT